jgi:glycosyltransferase EpsH
MVIAVKISVIIPVYNVENYLCQCIDSVLAQDYSELEIILVDDGSPDYSGAICDAYARKDPRIVVVHKENEGAAIARKSGLYMATGKYVLFLDGDDWLEPNTISSCADIAEKDNADCVMFGYIREYPQKSIPNPLFEQSFSYDLALSEEKVHRRVVGLLGDELREPHRIDNLSSFCMRMFRTEVAKRGRFVSDRRIGTSEDTIFNIYALDGCKISYINQCYYHYRKTNTQSITTMHKPDLADKWDTMYAVIQEYIRDSGKADIYQVPFLNRVACGMIGLGLNEVSSSQTIWTKAERIREILNKPLYQEAFAQLDISYCGMKWKVFFQLCKHRTAFLLTVLLTIMNHLRSRMAV